MHRLNDWHTSANDTPVNSVKIAIYNKQVNIK